MESLRQTNQTNHHPDTKSVDFIIAITASEGIMDDLHSIFDDTPEANVAYIIIHNHTLGHHNLIKTLLSVHPKLKLCEIEDEMEVKCNCVYVMPEGKALTIENKKLRLKDWDFIKMNNPIDQFLISLSEDQGNRSIGIMLSGSDNDGIDGSAAIKNMGGMVIVQDPESTSFNYLPRKVIASGNFDFIMSPKLMSVQLEKFIQRHSENFEKEDHSNMEKLISANEEMQNINDELKVLNQNYQSKIKELEDSNDDFTNYFESTNIPQIQVDRELIIIRYTPVFIKHINIKEEDIGRHLGDLSTNLKFSNLLEDIESVIKTKIEFETQVETNDGKWYHLTIHPFIRARDEKADGAIFTFHDITAIQKSAQTLEKANQRLMKINEDHDTFIYSVSHDLKAPVNNIEGLVMVLNESDDPEEVKQVLNMIQISVLRLKETIAELANITNIEKDHEEATQVNVVKLFNEVKTALNDSFQKSEGEIHVEFKEREIKFSKKYLRSILLNLLSNAIKYRSNERRLEVKVTTEKVDEFIVLTFQDNGMGIAEDKKNELFSKFKRVHDLHNEIEGTGIGLFLIKKIINNEGGQIEVESELGKGSTFRVYFKH